jgi:hypothetical protein
MIRWLKRVPISGWYVKSLLAGLGLLVLLFLLSLPIEHRDGYSLYLFAVRIVDQQGNPVAGGSVFESDIGVVDPQWGYFGATDEQGFVYGYVPMMWGGSVSIVGIRTRRMLQRSTQFYIQRRIGDLVLLGRAQGIPVPEKVSNSLPKSVGHDPDSRQINSLPSWAANIQILHATIER